VCVVVGCVVVTGALESPKLQTYWTTPPDDPPALNVMGDPAAPE
jgi:hypothetical protein